MDRKRRPDRGEGAAGHGPPAQRRRPARSRTRPPIFGHDATAGLGLDSIDALELVVLVEEKFHVSIPDEEVGKRAFASVAALVDFIVEAQAADGGLVADAVAITGVGQSRRSVATSPRSRRVCVEGRCGIGAADPVRASRPRRGRRPGARAARSRRPALAPATMRRLIARRSLRARPRHARRARRRGSIPRSGTRPDCVSARRPPACATPRRRIAGGARARTGASVSRGFAGTPLSTRRAALSQALGVFGPRATLSTACSSSALAIAAAAGMRAPAARRRSPSPSAAIRSAG